MNDKSAGSYDFDEFNAEELARLQHQAKIALELERRLWADMDIAPAARVLDVASGPGLTSLALADIVPEGSVLGVELNADLLVQAKSHLAESSHQHVRFEQGNAYDLAVAPGSIDFAYARLLFQHLEDPCRALRSIQSTLAPGGRVCVVDVDDGWLSVDPDSPAFTEFVDLACTAQHANGGDRRVGRKLYRYMLESGFTDISIRVVPFGSHVVGMRNFLDITTGFKVLQLPEAQREHGQRLLEQVYALCDDPQAFGVAGIFAVTGTVA